MTRKTLWTFGCSFTSRYHPIDDSYNPSIWDDYKKWRGGNVPKVWPVILGEMLDYDVKNCGEGGSSNHYIFSKFIGEHKNLVEGDMVIIGWTSLLRFWAYNEKDGYMNNILPSYIDTKGPHLFSHQTLIEIFNNRSNSGWCKELWEWVSFINTFCKLKGIEIYHWNSDKEFFNDKYIDMDEVNTFITTPDGNLDVFEFSRRLYSNGKHSINLETSGEIMDLHSGEFGHLSQAKYFFEFIKKHKNKTGVEDPA